MQSGEEMVLAGPSTLKAELNTSTRKRGFGLLGWENLGLGKSWPAVSVYHGS